LIGGCKASNVRKGVQDIGQTSTIQRCRQRSQTLVLNGFGTDLR
jgi:hypothetical protein